MRRFLTLAAVAVMSLGVAQADWLGLSNGSFEQSNGGQTAWTTNASTSQSIPLEAGAFGVFKDSGAVPGWTPTNDQGIEIQNMGAASGTQAAELDTHGVFGSGYPGEYLGHNGGMTQDFTIDPADAGVFQVSLSYKIHQSGFSDPYTGGNSTYAIGIYIDDVQVGIIDDPTASSWTGKSTGEFQILSGGHTIKFAALGYGDSFGGLLDLVSLDRVGSLPPEYVPEPTTVLLVGAGLAGLFFIRRRQSV